MNQNLVKHRNLLDLFSSCLVKDGKKGSGYRILLKSLFFLRQKADRNVLNLSMQNHNVKAFSSKEFSQIDKLKIFSNNKSLNPIIAAQDKKNEGAEEIEKIILGRRKNEENLQNKKEKNKKKKEISFFTEGENGGTKIFKKEEISSQGLATEQIVLTTLPNKSICKKCVDNVKPILETRKVRKGRVTYRVPLVTNTQRQEGKAVSFLIENATLKKKVASSTFNKSIQLKPLIRLNLPSKDFFSSPLQSKVVVSEAIKARAVPTAKPTSSVKMKVKNLPLVREVSKNEKSLQVVCKSRFAKDIPSIKLLKKRVEKDLLTLLSEREMLFIATSNRLNLYSIKQTLSEQFFDAFLKRGESVEKKKQLHNLALQNRAYTHYRWW